MLDEDNLSDLELFLTEQVQVNGKAFFFEMKSGEGFTLLHLCTFKNKMRPFNLVARIANELLKSYTSKVERVSVLKKWVDAQTFRDKFSALHYASFRGNVEMAKILVSLGASVNLKNRHGLNVLHVAAQGD